MKHVSVENQAKCVSFEEFSEFYKKKLLHRSHSFENIEKDKTYEFKYFSLTFDSRDKKIWKIVLDPGHPHKELEASMHMQYDGTILDLIEHLLDERRRSRNSGAI